MAGYQKKAEPRGWVEIVEVQHLPDLHPITSFHVYDWTESMDAGTMLHSFGTRREAVEYAVRWAVLTGRKLWTAEVFHLRQQGGAA